MENKEEKEDEKKEIGIEKETKIENEGQEKSTELVETPKTEQKWTHKIKSWSWNTFFKVYVRNAFILLLIFYLTYIMMNIFLKSDRVVDCFQMGEYAIQVEETNLSEGEKDRIKESFFRIITGYWIMDRNGYYTIAVYLATFFILKSIVGKSKTACLILAITELGFEVINYIVTSLRGGGVTLADIYSIQTAINVAQGIKPQFDGFFVAGIFCFIGILTIILTVKIKEKKIKLWQRASFLVLGCSIIGVIAHTTYITEEISIWNVNYAYKWHGSPLTVIKMLSDVRVDKPEGYNEGEVKAILAEKEENQDISMQEDWPNIIVIMNESFADMYQVAEIGKQDPIPYYRRLIQKDNVVSGTMYSSEFGGKTANVEYEFLTQNTTAFLPVGAVPYQQYSQKNRENLAQSLKKLGYKTSAIHSWYKSGYTRVKVYTLYGFDLRSFYEDLPDLVESFNEEHPTDLSTYQEIIRELEEKEEGTKLFNFTVTMQNHIPYTAEDENMLKYSDDPEINSYLQLLHLSDEALAYLIEELEKQEEKVILLFFGDHQPKLQNVESDLSSIEVYQVPYFIWANYEIEAEQGKDTSTNYLQTILMDYAGLPKTSYMKYMSELRETIPIINKQFYQDSTGTIYNTTDKSSPDYEKIEEYQKVVYYQMFH